MIELRARSRLVGAGDVLSKVIDRNAGAEFVDRLGGADRVRHRGAGNEAAGGALANAGLLGDVPQPPAFRESDERCPQHGAPCSNGIGLPETCIGIDSIFYHKLCSGGCLFGGWGGWWGGSGPPPPGAKPRPPPPHPAP